MKVTLTNAGDREDYGYELREGIHIVGRAEGAPFKSGVYLINDEFKEGRLLGKDGTVGRGHLEITVSESEVKLEDKASRFGTYVDGIPIKTTTLGQGDYELQLGEHTAFDLMVIE